MQAALWLAMLAPAALGSPLPRAPRWHELTAAFSYDEFVAIFRAHSPPVGRERAEREALFAANLDDILVHNAEDHGWKKGVNQFTDMSEEEFASRLASPAAIRAAAAAAPASAAASSPRPPLSGQALPASVDWRTKGVLTAVKDQGGCGSCWAFASTEMIESYAAMSVTPPSLTDLSPQQLVSCAPNLDECDGVGGCDGSVPELAFDYVKAVGMATEWSIPYTAHDGRSCHGNPGQPGCPCAYNASTSRMLKAVTLEGFVKLPQNDQTAVMSALATVGPLAVNVQANTWSSYVK